MLSRVKPRKLKRLYDRRPEMVERLKKDFLAEHERRLKASRVGQTR